MKKLYRATLRSLLPLALAALFVTPLSAHAPDHMKGLGVSYPWSFHSGNKTSRETARRSADEILSKAGYATVPMQAAISAWQSKGFPKEGFRDRPTNAQLKAYGKSLHAAVVLFGDVDWNTRSIWVNLGPKTISTAKVDVYVFDVASKKIIYKRVGTQGRSDEPENGWKIAADVLVTPLVTSVSGGPATPREQRAVQIALGKALHDWVKGNR